MDNNTRVSRLNAAEALAQLQSSPTLGPASTSVSRGAKQSVKFPEILMNMINDEQNSCAVTWMSDGRSFAITNRKKFCKSVLPRYFKQAKYTSFTRRLNRWGFSCFVSGSDTCVYSHQLFNRDRPDLSEYMSASMNNSNSNKFKKENTSAKKTLNPLLSSSLSIQPSVPQRSIPGYMSLAHPSFNTNIQASLPPRVPVVPEISPDVTNSIVGAAVSALHRGNVMDMNLAYTRALLEKKKNALLELGLIYSPFVQPAVEGAHAA